MRDRLIAAWVRRHPLDHEAEAQLVDEVERCWDGVPLPAPLDSLLDEARRDCLGALTVARAAACDGPEATGLHLQVASLLPLETLLGNGTTLVLTPTFGRWSTIAPALARRGYRVGLLDLRPPGRRPRQSLPAAPGLDLRSLPATGLARPIVRFAVEPRSVIVALADEGCGPRQAHGALFGRPATVGSTPFELARRMGLGVLPVFAVREHGVSRLLLEKPLRIADTGRPDHDLDVNAGRWLKLVERNARRYPHHYLGHLLGRRRSAPHDPVLLFDDAAA